MNWWALCWMISELSGGLSALIADSSNKSVFFWPSLAHTSYAIFPTTPTQSQKELSELAHHMCDVILNSLNLQWQGRCALREEDWKNLIVVGWDRSEAHFDERERVLKGPSRGQCGTRKDEKWTRQVSEVSFLANNEEFRFPREKIANRLTDACPPQCIHEFVKSVSSHLNPTVECAGKSTKCLVHGAQLNNNRTKLL